MGKEVTLLEVFKLPVGGKDKEDFGIELSLELSLGGRHEDSQSPQEKIEKNPFDEKLQNLDFCNSGIATRSEFYCGNGIESMDLKRRREFQALRRREARRKREAKTKSWRFVLEDKLLLEGQRIHGRVQDREIRERDDVFLSRENSGKKNGLTLSLSSNQHAQMHSPSLDFDSKPSDVSDLKSTSSQKGGSSSDSGSHSSPSQHRSNSEPIISDPHCDSPPLAEPNKILQHQTDKSKVQSNRVLRKPPKPPSHSQSPSPRSTMPCVSAKGNGPNGKTVKGILRKYTATEIVITCVCHGTSLSPAEFVEHAGCINVTHPLRHITMVNI